MKITRKKAILLHSSVPEDWYEASVKRNPFQFLWHKLRARKLREYSRGLGGYILDIGCADGYFTHIIRKSTNSSKVVGIDILSSSIKYAKRRYEHDRAMLFLPGDAHALPFAKNSFHVVYSIESLEHVCEPKKVLSEIYRVLKPQGTVIILIPAETVLFKLIWLFWVNTYGRIWKGTHLHTFEPSKLPEMMEKKGFIIEKHEYFILGMLLIVKARKNKVNS